MTRESPEALPIVGVIGMGRDVTWTVLALVVNGVGTLGGLAYALRRVGAFDFGVFTLASSIVTVLVVVDFGLGTSAIHAVARQVAAVNDAQRRRAQVDAETSHSVLVALGVIVTLGGVAFAYLVPVIVDVPRSQLSEVITTSVLVGAATGLAIGTSALPGAVRGARDFRAVSLAATAGVVCRLLLLVLLLGHLGLVALGVAQLGGVLVERALLAVWTRHHLPWFRLRPTRFGRAAVRRTASVAVPLVILAIDTQLVAASDAVVIGAVVGATAIAVYRVGSVAPAQAIQALFRGADVAFPGLVERNKTQQMEIAIFITRVWSYIAGVGFTALILFRRDVVVVLLGHRSSTAELVLVLFCVTFAVDAIPHTMVLVLIARGRQRLLAALAPVELILNLALTVYFVQRWGASGAAWAAISSFLLIDLALFPLVVRKELTPSVVVILAEGFGALAVGSLACLAGAAIPVTTMSPSIARACAGALAGGAVGLGAGLLVLGKGGRDNLRGTFRRQAPSAIA